MARELKPGDTYYLYYIMNGMLKKEWVFTAVEFQRIHLSSHDLNNPTLVDHFRSREDQLICITGKTDPNACSHIGPFKIGAPYKAMDNPWKEIAQNNGVTVTAYPIINNDKHNAYWVIGHKAGTITSLQLTGNYADDKLSFSSIKLDDSQDKVKSILGPRYRVKQLQDINGEMWDYYPFPISIEFVKGKVYSIRVTETNNP
ncbi:MAG: hypothetical protein OEY07_18645, partial [Gammaproteobacteria bacterium]|nr:hypothetical protein [Gammaproteobacteria bacterium]